MTETELRRALGERDWATVTQHAEIVAREGDVEWIILPLADGRWAATDDAEIDADRMEFFATREEALAFQQAGWEASHPEDDPNREDTDRFGWLGGI